MIQSPKLLNIALPTRRKTIERAFGRKLPQSFDNFEEKPVASGSIAQVHGAGQQVKPIVVAVKVRHPGVCESITRDFVIINLVAELSNFILALKWWRLDESVQQLAVFIMSQVDLPREAAHLCIMLFWWKLMNKGNVSVILKGMIGLNLRLFLAVAFVFLPKTMVVLIILQK
ncbi:hypothetical protein L3X38_020612 [Prunus dulcis]|uniref:ABC1 atypical kinase-like domain-containing protein n=1 Tax=Prunus dulcis TaxID=3755 RepID=A0AAD4WE43_PRUDU|nr:hypothetical protein L3X38_020612 [Prunus dulcis]